MPDERMVALAEVDPEMRAYFENEVCRCRPCNAVRTALLHRAADADPTAQSDDPQGGTDGA